MAFVSSTFDFLGETMLSVLVFGSVAIFTVILAGVVQTARADRRRLALTEKRFAPRVRGRGRGRSAEGPVLETRSDAVGQYYRALHAWKGDDIKSRLVKAGYFREEDVATFRRIRYGLTVGAVCAVVLLALILGVGSLSKIALVALPVGGLGYLIPTFALDRIVKKKMAAMEGMFPDFIDMLVVCVEAGLTLEAAVMRIANEMKQTAPLFAIHLQIVMLEIRAGKPTRQALNTFAERTAIPEAQSLVSFVRQSEELGVSVSSALRVYAQEMRQRRALSAEEQANALPTKMLLPIAAFLFPTTLVIVLAPVIFQLVRFFDAM